MSSGQHTQYHAQVLSDVASIPQRPSDERKHRRRFIGPMPERIVQRMMEPVSSTPKRRVRFTRFEDHDSDVDEGVHNAIREHALQFFLGHGGKREDWGESQERSVREEMYKRWKQSEWGQARSDRARKREAKRDKHWVGTSFDVGVFLGVDTLVHSSATPHKATTPAASISRIATSRAVSRSEAGETFVTAPSIPQESTYLSARANGAQGPGSDHSTTPLLYAGRPEIRMTEPEASQRALHSEEIEPSAPPASPKGRRRSVHYADEPPASPNEVLGRTGNEVQDTSAGAAWQATAENQIQWGDVIMRDRMLVQVSFTNNQSLPANFDETLNRTTSQLQYEDWEEYIVAWRKNRLELYNDHWLPCKERFVGHKRLAFVIPLSQAATKLSLYSFTDSTFCLTCPPQRIRTRSGATSRWLLYGTTKGTNIFIFNVRSRTRAVDWMWQLWRHLGGQLPASIEIRCPILDTRLKVDIPGHDHGDAREAYTVFTPANTIGLCKKVLGRVEDYEKLIEHEIESGTSLGLAWRIDMRLDWVWHTDDVEGKNRDWAVLYGLALKQGKNSAHLELRMKQHRPQRVRLKDGTQLDEPSGIEGYLDRIKPTSQMKQSMYISTHDGYIFFINAAQTLPPSPPSVPPASTGADDLRKGEVFRGAQQILRASGITDLRNVAAVRRAFQYISSQTEEVPVSDATVEDSELWAQTESYEDDPNDVGGEEGLNQAPDRVQRRLRRSFELLLTSGRVVRFEIALEWIARLRPLISYWKKRHQADARNEMDLLYASTGRSRITPLKRVDDDDRKPIQGPPSSEDSSPDLSFLYNWCVLDGCRPITKSGRLFSRRGVKGQYSHVLLVLVPGHLVEFRITNTSVYHRRGNVIHLLDAYVCSGYFAAQHLPEGQYDPDSPPLPRRYQDGLESDDRDEDTLFMIWWYRGRTAPPNVTDTVPPLSGNRRIAVFRTRSKLERDTWVWAIKSEVEKAVRAAREREDKVRAAGNLLKT